MPGELQTRTSAEFVESSVLEAIVPANSDCDIEKELEAWDGAVEDESGSILPFIPQRTLLLLDEQLPIYIVFRTPLLDEETLEKYLSRLAIDLEGFAFSTAPQPENEPKGPTKELIHSSTIKDTEKPLILRHGDGDAASSYVVWKVDVFVGRPQGRFSKPAVYFQPTASFKPALTPPKAEPEDEYLPTNTPMAINLLQAFEGDPAFFGVQPRLSAMRISKMAPSATPAVTRELVRPIRSGQRPHFRVLPALIWRIRYARVQTSLNDLSLLASLDLDVSPYHNYDVRISKVDLSLSGGTVTPFANPSNAEALYKSGDQITYLYKITPDVSSDGTPTLGSKGHILSISISSSVLLSPTCHSSLQISWKTPVDFTSVLTQSPTLLKAAHRLSNPTTTAQAAPKPANPDALPAHDTAADDPVANTAINMTLTISGPPRVSVGETFTWTIFLVNRGPTPRKLAVLVLPKRKRDYDRAPRSSGSTSSFDAGGSTKAPSQALLAAAAVVDENVVYAKQKAARVDAAEVICLTTDIRLGQLAPGSCYMADLKFVALREGPVGVESVRVVDLATNEMVDVRDLPSVVAVKEGKGVGDEGDEDDEEEEGEDEDEGDDDKDEDEDDDEDEDEDDDEDEDEDEEE